MDGYTGDGNENAGVGRRAGNRRVAVGLFCISRARAEHLRCKILNPGASAISPTSSAGRRIEDGEKEIEWVEEGGDRGGLEAAPQKGKEDTARRLCGAHSASLHLNVKVPSAARRKLLFCIRKLMIASELCF